jgi:hypothetical protein
MGTPKQATIGDTMLLASAILNQVGVLIPGATLNPIAWAIKTLTEDEKALMLHAKINPFTGEIICAPADVMPIYK